MKTFHLLLKTETEHCHASVTLHQFGRPPVQVQGQGAVQEEPVFSYMCSSYRLSTVLEDSDDQSCGSGRLTFGEPEQYAIHEHKSPVILKFLQERLEEEGRFKKREFEEAQTARVLHGVPEGSTLPSALDEGSLPGLFPSSPVGRVQRSFPAPSLRVRGSPSTPEMPSRKFQEYQCSDGSTFRGRLPPGIFPNRQPGELPNVHVVFPSRSLRLACPEYLFSDDRTFNGRTQGSEYHRHLRPPSQPVPKPQPGGLLRV